MPTALIGLGSSLGPRRTMLGLAASLFESWPGIQPVSRSRIYLSAPMGPASRPFLNAAIRVETDLSGTELLRICKAIEQRLGRASANRWMDRVIDVDILLLGGELIEDPELKVPHSGLLVRSFALIPAAEIGGELVHPGFGKMLRDCAIPKPVGLRLQGCL